jgi:hypothetical protein
VDRFHHHRASRVRQSGTCADTRNEIDEGLESAMALSSPGDVTREALTHLQMQFGATTSTGTVMVVRATQRLEDPDMIAAPRVVLADELISAFQ